MNRYSKAINYLWSQRCGYYLFSMSYSSKAEISNVMIDAEDNPKISIPPYREREGEPLKILKARLVYQSRRRGNLENGLLLSTFAAKFLNSMSYEQLRVYDRLINKPSNDWDIYHWASDTKPAPEEFQTEVLTMLKNHVKNMDKESRFVQPDLNP